MAAQHPAAVVRRFAGGLLAGVVCLFALAAGAEADTYPSKPITFIVPFAAGSATDQIARALGQGINTATGKTVVVDDKPGASGFIAAEQVAKAAPDGYTVFITTNTTQAANEHLFKKLPYDPVKDFTPVTALGIGGQIMVVNPGRVAAKTVGEFIQLAKKEPGKLTFGSGSSSSRVAGELFQQMAGVQLVNVPYKSNPLAINDLLGGQIDMMITDMATGLPQVKGGKLRALGVSSRSRSPLAPDIPTIDEAGVKGYEVTYWFAAYLPARASAEIVDRLHGLLADATRSPQATAFYTGTGTQVYLTSPAELGKFQVQESKKWGQVIRAANIEPE